MLPCRCPPSPTRRYAAGRQRSWSAGRPTLSSPAQWRTSPSSPSTTQRPVSEQRCGGVLRKQGSNSGLRSRSGACCLRWVGSQEAQADIVSYSIVQAQKTLKLKSLPSTTQRPVSEQRCEGNRHFDWRATAEKLREAQEASQCSTMLEQQVSEVKESFKYSPAPG